jgi:hypothetical protein
LQYQQTWTDYPGGLTIDASLIKSHRARTNLSPGTADRMKSFKPIPAPPKGRARHRRRVQRLALLAAALSPAALWAEPAPWARLQWSSSAGYSHYREPSIGMHLKGPELGAHLQLSDLRGLGRLRLEVDLLGGAQNYSSADGPMEHKRTLDSRWHALYQLVPGGAAQGLYAGLALQSSYSDLRGVVRPGVVGYERLNLSGWLTAQWRQSVKVEALPRLQGVQLDLGHLLEGRQTSYLSQVGGNWRDVTNKQPWGWQVQLQSTWTTERGLLFEPFVRYTQVGHSDTVISGSRAVMEPANSRWQLGLKATWPPN